MLRLGVRLGRKTMRDCNIQQSGDNMTILNLAMIMNILEDFVEK